MSLPANLQNALAALLEQPGATEQSLRRGVLECNRSGDGQIPEGVRDFVDKIAAQPWTVSDEDFHRLRAAGYTESQLYEITLAAALGAGVARFDAGLRAIEEAG
jgi:hypothetical protein